ncbi:hypothetical protein BRCON_0281 [Candidatus Sumerlaea chitinivorans]|uniref:Uncharacterized protein n=1 Tax=Sumerlaea chitinivorans TaxID=2250252 RepID=A0A2Z4Y2H7_SUMC1|nr:hypothetical protein BRCON_0281 [Candidatus Sumerlaea chitinivorans]
MGRTERPITEAAEANSKLLKTTDNSQNLIFPSRLTGILAAGSLVSLHPTLCSLFYRGQKEIALCKPRREV